jgi:hypothetical protein
LATDNTTMTRRGLLRASEAADPPIERPAEAVGVIPTDAAA